MSDQVSIGFIGAGKMATALAQGFVRAGLATASQLVASEVREEGRRDFERVVGGRAVESSLEVLRLVNTVVLAVKPDQVVPVLQDIRSAVTPGHLVISIAAGMPLSRLEGALFEGVRVVRVMPNTPALVGASASGLARGRWATDEDARLTARLFSAVGLAVEVPERLLDGVTGLSGSGPAYVYQVIEALSDGGVAVGLPRDIATRLAAQTVVGAGRMVIETGLHPGVLKDMVTSPGGTTIEGLHELEKAGVRGAFMNAVRASAEKAKRMGQG
jgi:pyrroline-5-carboxylate reductase